MDHSGCTCERLQDQQTVHTGDDDCTDSTQRMQGLEGGGNRLCRYLPAKGVGGARGGGAVIGEMKDLADIRVLTEAEGTVSVRVDRISSSSSSFFCCFFPRALERLPCWKGCRGTSAFGWRSTPASSVADIITF